MCGKECLFGEKAVKITFLFSPQLILAQQWMTGQVHSGWGRVRDVMRQAHPDFFLVEA